MLHNCLELDLAVQDRQHCTGSEACSQLIEGLQQWSKRQQQPASEQLAPTPQTLRNRIALAVDSDPRLREDQSRDAPAERPMRRLMHSMAADRRSKAEASLQQEANKAAEGLTAEQNNARSRQDGQPGREKGTSVKLHLILV